MAKVLLEGGEQPLLHQAFSAFNLNGPNHLACVSKCPLKLENGPNHLGDCCVAVHRRGRPGGRGLGGADAPRAHGPQLCTQLMYTALYALAHLQPAIC